MKLYKNTLYLTRHPKGYYPENLRRFRQPAIIEAQNQRLANNTLFPLSKQQLRNIEYIKSLKQSLNSNDYLFKVHLRNFYAHPDTSFHKDPNVVSFKFFIKAVYPFDRLIPPNTKQHTYNLFIIKKKPNGLSHINGNITISPANYHYYINMIYIAINNLTL